MTGSSRNGIDITSTASSIFKGVSVTNNSISNAGDFFKAQSSSASFTATTAMFKGLLTGGSTLGKFLSFETVADAGNIFVVNTNGSVGIGTSTPYARLTVWGTDTASTSPFTVANSASTTVFAVYNNGNATYSGLIFQSSDERLKTNITPLDASSSLAAVLGLNPVSYTRIDQSDLGTNLGFVAQDVEQIFPNLVSTSSPTALTPDGTLTLNYVGLIAPIVEAIKELAGQVSSLAATVVGFAQSFTSQNITATQRLCVGSTCVTESQLKTLLQDSSQQGSASAASTITITDVPTTPNDSTAATSTDVSIPDSNTASSTPDTTASSTSPTLDTQSITAASSTPMDTTTDQPTQTDITDFSTASTTSSNN